MKTNNLGMLLLAVFLIVYGVMSLIPKLFFGIVLAVLAIVAGVLILIGK